jgi:LysM repeat protein
MRIAPIITLAVLLLVPRIAAAEETKTTTVQEGDTLIGLAKRHGVSVDDLRRYNGLSGDVIRIGATLHTAPQIRERRITKGETLNAIALSENVSLATIVKLNPGLKPNHIQAGQSLRLPVSPPPPAPPPEPPLTCPGKVVQLTGHASYRLRSKEVGWLTSQAARALDRAFDSVRRQHGSSLRARVLDASRREGGQLGAHRSHRDGRDVDITYFQNECGPAGCPLRNVKPSQLDVVRQWTLLRHWLVNDDVQYLFVDHDLQAALYDHANKTGATDAQLEEWFQYPRPASVRVGKIRHWDAHKNHVHVRFHEAECPNACCTAPSVARSGGSDSPRGR